MYVCFRMVIEGTMCQKVLDGRHEQGTRAKVPCTLTSTTILNTIKHVTRPTSKRIYHQQERETPAPLHVSTRLQNAGGRKAVINSFTSIDMSVSYERITQISTDLAMKVSEQFCRDGICSST